MSEKGLNCVIIDDERAGIDALRNLIETYGEGVTVVGTADSIQGGRALIESKEPDLIFLDVQFPEGTGFEILDMFPNRTFQVIFVTAYDQHALEAIRNRATDYLLKPISIPELKEAMSYAQTQEVMAHKKEGENADEGYLKTFAQKLAIPTSQGYDYLQIDRIMYLEADGMYTIVFLDKEEKVVVSKGLSRFEGTLASKGFLRVHRSFLINLNFISRVNRNDGYYIEMKDGRHVPVPFRNRKFVIDHINKLTNTID